MPATAQQTGPRVGQTTRPVEIYRRKFMEKIGAHNGNGIALYTVKHGIYKV